MAELIGGKVTVTAAGTIEKVSKFLTAQQILDLKARVFSVEIQVLPANTGVVYIGTSAMVVSTGVGVLYELPIKVSATTGPFTSHLITGPALGGNSIDLDRLYLDVGTNGDGVYVSAITV